MLAVESHKALHLAVHSDVLRYLGEQLNSSQELVRFVQIHLRLVIVLYEGTS